MGKQKRKNAKSKNNEDTKKYTKKNGKKNIRENSNKDTEKDINKKNNKNGEAKKKGFWKRHRKLALFIKICIILAILLVIIAAGAVVAIFTNDEWAMTKEDLTLKYVDSIIYDKDGNEIANVSGEEKRRIVSLSEIPDSLEDAYIAIEDKRFAEHKGIDIKRTLGATVKYILNKGHSSYGGSTITQQLIKNLKKDNSDSGLEGIQRKIREMSRAYKLEKMLSKDQILELYLNTIFVGGEGNLHGVELASRYYFNKSVTDLDLAECAFLAGINHAPNSYNPFNGSDNSESIKTRTKVVLGEMKNQGKINDEEYETAKAEVEEGLKFENGNTSTSSSMSYLARAALNQVIEQYAEKNDVSKEIAQTMIEGGGYKIYTTQDSAIQADMEEVYRSGESIFKGVAVKNGVKVNEGHTQSAMVVIDHKTGQVVGCMGGLGDDVNSIGQNRATQTKRQPGSSIKPLAAVAPALESGIITAATVYDESRTYFGDYSPTPDIVGSELTTIRRGLAFSANTTYVKVLSELGPGNSIDFMRKLGITTLVKASENKEHNDENLPLALGGITYGITPLEMAGAYAAIANDGVYITPIFYTRVEDSNGTIILEPTQEKNRLISEGNAYILKSMLKGSIEGPNGTAGSLCRISGQDAAGKTGTTTDNYDRWYCGFTNYYTAATWFGFDQPENLYPAGANYPNRAAKLWGLVMKKVHADLPSARFEKPSNVVSAEICLDSGKVATEGCSRTYTEYFVRGTIPGECEGHEKLTICTDTGKIATEYCKNTEEKIYTKKPEKEDTTSWRTDSGDKYDIPTETCDVHTKREIIMPNVVGKTKEEAMKILKDLGLKVTVETEESSKEEGTVIKQSKKEGSKLTTEDSITITVSKEKKHNNNEIDDENIIDNNEIYENNEITNTPVEDVVD